MSVESDWVDGVLTDLLSSSPSSASRLLRELRDSVRDDDSIAKVVAFAESGAFPWPRLLIDCLCRIGGDRSKAKDAAHAKTVWRVLHGIALEHRDSVAWVLGEAAALSLGKADRREVLRLCRENLEAVPAEDVPVVARAWLRLIRKPSEFPLAVSSLRRAVAADQTFATTIAKVLEEEISRDARIFSAFRTVLDADHKALTGFDLWILLTAAMGFQTEKVALADLVEATDQGEISGNLVEQVHKEFGMQVVEPMCKFLRAMLQCGFGAGGENSGRWTARFPVIFRICEVLFRIEAARLELIRILVRTSSHFDVCRIFPAICASSCLLHLANENADDICPFAVYFEEAILHRRTLPAILYHRLSFIAAKLTRKAHFLASNLKIYLHKTLTNFEPHVRANGFLIAIFFIQETFSLKDDGGTEVADMQADCNMLIDLIIRLIPDVLCIGNLCSRTIICLCDVLIRIAPYLSPVHCQNIISDFYSFILKAGYIKSVEDDSLTILQFRSGILTKREAYFQHRSVRFQGRSTTLKIDKEIMFYVWKVVICFSVRPDITSKFPTSFNLWREHEVECPTVTDLERSSSLSDISCLIDGISEAHQYFSALASFPMNRSDSNAVNFISNLESLRDLYYEAQERLSSLSSEDSPLAINLGDQLPLLPLESSLDLFFKFRSNLSVHFCHGLMRKVAALLDYGPNATLVLSTPIEILSNWYDSFESVANISDVFKIIDMFIQKEFIKSASAHLREILTNFESHSLEDYSSQHVLTELCFYIVKIFTSLVRYCKSKQSLVTTCRIFSDMVESPISHSTPSIEKQEQLTLELYERFRSFASTVSESGVAIQCVDLLIALTKGFKISYQVGALCFGCMHRVYPNFKVHPEMLNFHLSFLDVALDSLFFCHSRNSVDLKVASITRKIRSEIRSDLEKLSNDLSVESYLLWRGLHILPRDILQRQILLILKHFSEFVSYSAPRHELMLGLTDDSAPWLFESIVWMQVGLLCHCNFSKQSEANSFNEMSIVVGILRRILSLSIMALGFNSDNPKLILEQVARSIVRSSKLAFQILKLRLVENLAWANSSISSSSALDDSIKTLCVVESWCSKLCDICSEFGIDTVEGKKKKRKSQKKVMKNKRIAPLISSLHWEIQEFRAYFKEQISVYHLDKKMQYQQISVEEDMENFIDLLLQAVNSENVLEECAGDSNRYLEPIREIIFDASVDLSLDMLRNNPGDILDYLDQLIETEETMETQEVPKKQSRSRFEAIFEEEFSE